MHLSPPQLKRIWREWSSIVKSHQWPAALAEDRRHALLQRAGFTSLKEVDHLAGYTRVLKEVAILKDDLSALLHAEQNPERVLKHSIQALADAPYWQRICKDRFHTVDLDDLSLDQLTQLRNTLAARSKLPKAARAQASSLPEPENCPF